MALTTSGRPTFVKWAVVLIAINAVGGVVSTAFWPDIEDRATVLTVSSIISVVLLVTAWFVWNGNRWGTIAAIVANGLNALLAVPGYFNADPKSIVVGVSMTIVLSAATIALLAMPESRKYWNGRGARARGVGPGAVVTLER